MSDDSILSNAEKAVERLDGYFSIVLHDDGVYLTVNPPLGNGAAIREPVILEELKQRNIKDFNFAAISRTIREASGTPVCIAPPQAAEEEPEIQVLVSRDRMEASLQIIIAKNSRKLLLDEVMAKIEQTGIVYGIDQEAVNKAFERPGIRVTCAHGLKPLDGENAKIHYHIDLENKGRPAELEDGKVDFKNLNMFTTVREGELLAEKIPPTQGTPGKDILGQGVPAKPGKDILFPAGKNVQLVNNSQLIATTSGQLLIANNKINVIPVIEIRGDVDLSTGNIEFVGNVVVRGSVQSGFTVKAEGNVEVAGTVGGAIIEGKNIVVRMGIQGMNRGYIKAAENVVAKFIENATVYAGNDVMVADVVLHSRINAAKKVLVEGRRGLIAGGQISAGEEIRAKTAGTHLASTTDLQVGVNPLMREEYLQLRKEIKQLDFNLDQTQKALAILKGMDPARLSNDKREMLLKLTKAQFHLVGQAETMRNRLAEIELAFEEMRFGKIRISDLIYPGVKIVVGTLIKPIREMLKFSSFYEEDGEIKIGPFK